MATIETHPIADLERLRRTARARVLEPGDDGYDRARTPWNLAVDQRPLAVALPGDAAAVQEIVRFARARGLRVAAQGTGHGAAALGDLSDTILLRTHELREVVIDVATPRARVGAGALWQDVVEPATTHGLTALHGSSPDVGVAGYTLGGGIGWLARRHGLAANSLIAIELVTADGELHRVDHHHEPDLFWALRGGGGNFGVVTSLELALLPLERAYAGWLVWPWERAAEVLQRWSEWSRTVPDELTSLGRILQLPPLPQIPEPLRGRDLAVVELAYLGDAEHGEHLLRPLLELGPELSTVATMPAAGLARLHADPEGPTPGVGDGMLLDSLPADAVAALVEVAGPGSGSPFLSLEIRHLGGALARPAPGAGALSHLDGEFALYAVGVPFDGEQAHLLDRHLDTLTRRMAPWGRNRAYLNFAERPNQAAAAFDGDVHDRLQAIRTRVDPGQLFRANQPIAS
jgi:FAD/FMN-containing dehydrogenase